MGRFLRGGALYVIVLLIFVALVANVIRAGNPNVEELNSQEFQEAVDSGMIVMAPYVGAWARKG